ncbi:hypothetical protein T10_10146 [Trichinella papuae]|uniref:Uncharacterized protein n=1 Tax=Trichinella papuae TaxID=268474 RepID=A0A0V1M6T0_9BILA|nr:hypothetical protein T10_10146 [Trichinella papuae]
MDRGLVFEWIIKRGWFIKYVSVMRQQVQMSRLKDFLSKPHSGSLSNEDLKVLCTHNEPAIVDSEEDSSHHQISEIIDQFVEDDPDFERGCKARGGVLKIL